MKRTLIALFIASSLCPLKLLATELNADNPVNDEVIAQADADNG